MKLHTSKLGLLVLLALGAGDIRHRPVAEAAPSSFRGSAAANQRRLACSDNTKGKACREAGCNWTGTGQDAKCVDATPPPIEPPAPPPPPPTPPPMQSPTSAPTQSPTAAPAPAPEGAGTCSDDAGRSCFGVGDCACGSQRRGRKLEVDCASTHSNRNVCNGDTSCTWNKGSRVCEPAAAPTTNAPTGAPNPAPTDLPTGAPNPSPTPPPRPCECVGLSSDAPTDDPSSVPSTKPSSQPSSSPSEAPSKWPSPWPSSQPSSNPSEAPSKWPSPWPSSQPSSSPSKWPSPWPSSMPSSKPSPWPSSIPSSAPSPWPPSQPSSKPSPWPSSMPSSAPSPWPSSMPSSAPSGLPTSDPTANPSSDPTESAVPSSTPSSSAVPSSKPSPWPSSQPSTSSQPSSKPSPWPSSQPSSAPSGLCDESQLICIDTSLGPCQEKFVCVDGPECPVDLSYQSTDECTCGYCVADCNDVLDGSCTANCQYDWQNPESRPKPSSLLLAAPCQYENITVSLDNDSCRFNVTRGDDGYFNITTPLDVECEYAPGPWLQPKVRIYEYGNPPFNENNTYTDCGTIHYGCYDDGSFDIDTSCALQLSLNMTFGPQQDLRLVGMCFDGSYGVFDGSYGVTECAYLGLDNTTLNPHQCSNSSAQLF